MSPRDYLSLAEAVLIDGPQSTSTWVAIDFIRHAREGLEDRRDRAEARAALAASDGKRIGLDKLKAELGLG